MTGFMLSTPCPPYVLDKTNGGYHSQPGDDTMSKLALTFHNTHFNVIDREGQIWLTASEISQALGYAHENSVSRIYARNSDEFTDSMSQKVKLTLSGNYQKEVRIFSLRGAHLIGMFARTPIAKEFRKWVLDVLDKETVHHGLDEIDLNRIQGLCAHFRVLDGWWFQYGDTIRKLNRRMAASLHDHFNDGAWSVAALVKKYNLNVSSYEFVRNFPFTAEFHDQHQYYLVNDKYKSKKDANGADFVSIPVLEIKH